MCSNAPSTGTSVTKSGSVDKQPNQSTRRSPVVAMGSYTPNMLPRRTKAAILTSWSVAPPDRNLGFTDLPGKRNDSLANWSRICLSIDAVPFLQRCVRSLMLGGLPS